jgi:DNA-binding transcriptional MerR regulator
VGAGVTAPALHRIGEVAEDLGVSTRTLRYYEELGLVLPSAYSPGGARRYTTADRDRVLRIRDLQAVMGFDLDEIREILEADDRMAELRSEYAGGVTPKRHRDLIVEAARITARTLDKVENKAAALDAYRDELRAQAERIAARARELDVPLPEGRHPTAAAASGPRG